MSFKRLGAKNWTTGRSTKSLAEIEILKGTMTDFYQILPWIGVILLISKVFLVF